MGEDGVVEDVVRTVPIFDKRRRSTHVLALRRESSVKDCFELFDDFQTICVSKPAPQGRTSQEGSGQDAFEFSTNTVVGVDLLEAADDSLERETPPQYHRAKK